MTAEIGTLEILDAVDRLGPAWATALDRHPRAAVASALGRELRARTLTGVPALTEHGTETLRALRGGSAC